MEFRAQLREPLAHARDRHADFGSDLFEGHLIVKMKDGDHGGVIRFMAKQGIERCARRVASGRIGLLGDLREQIRIAVFGTAFASADAIETDIGGDSKQQG